jgi:arginase
MQVFCANWKKGQKKDGVDIGGLQICSKLNNVNYLNLVDHNIVYHNNLFNNLCGVKNTFLVGGDHSVGIGSVLASVNKNQNVGCLWIDAHPDINTFESSSSKNIHGMPLAFITGLETSWKWCNERKKLPFENLYYWGIRDIDGFEKETIINKNIKVINTIDKFVEDIHKFDCIHVSIDVDGIDPSFISSTGTPYKNGLILQDVLLAIKRLKTLHKNINYDLVEYNPLIGTDDEKELSKNTVTQIVETILK